MLSIKTLFLITDSKYWVKSYIDNMTAFGFRHKSVGLLCLSFLCKGKNPNLLSLKQPKKAKYHHEFSKKLDKLFDHNLN